MNEEIEISVEDVSLPPRSAFAMIDQKSRGTADVEGLWSYVYRWAAAHGFTMFGLLSALFPELFTGTMAEKSKVKVDFYQTYCSSRLNGCFSARSFLARIAGRVSVGDLEMLSNVSLEDVVYDNRGMRRQRMWCAKCYRLDLEPYDRLSWSWKSVTCCHRHNAVLIDSCAACGARQRFRGTATDLTKCERCSASLIVEVAPEPDAFEFHVARVAAGLIEMGQRRTLTAACIPIFWANVSEASRLAGGITVLSSLLGMSKVTLFCAHRDQRALSTLVVAKISWMTGIPVEPLLSTRQQITKLADPLPSWSSARRGAYTKAPRDSDAVLMVLLAQLRDEPYKPLIAHQLGRLCSVSMKHPSFQFPMVRELLRTQRHVAVRTQRALATWRYCERMREAIMQVESEGHIPCNSRLGRAIVDPGILRNKGVRRIRDGFLRAIRAGFRDVMITRKPPLCLQAAAKRSK